LADPRTVLSWLVGSAGIVFACAGLGAFSGCTSDFVQGARTGTLLSQGLFWGAAVGMTAGMAIAWWQQGVSYSRSSLWRFTLRFLYSCAWLLLAWYGLRADWTTAHNWTPAKVPLRVDQVNTVSATFVADMSATYRVYLDLKRTLPFEDLEEFTRARPDSEKSLHKGPPRSEIVWTVSNVSEEDRIVYWEGQSWGETVGLGLGEFKAAAGQRYTVRVQVVKPSPAVQVLDPHLHIALHYSIWPQYYTCAYFAQAGGMIAGVIGMFLLIRSLIQLRLNMWL
jgi:hypothetical protein